eukprot:6196516-Pleurochrysis_carterae.AAC.1
MVLRVLIHSEGMPIAIASDPSIPDSHSFISYDVITRLAALGCTQRRSHANSAQQQPFCMPKTVQKCRMVLRQIKTIRATKKERGQSSKILFSG